MADKSKRTGVEPVFDVDRAWNRFEQLVTKEPIPVSWTKAEQSPRTGQPHVQTHPAEHEHNPQKDGAVRMKEAQPMVGMISNDWRTENRARRMLRRWGVGGAAVVMAVGLFTLPWGDRVLAAMQQTFRIQHLVGVGISADDMKAISNVLENGSPEGDRSFDMAQYGTLTKSGGGRARNVTWSEANDQMGGGLIQLEQSDVPHFQPAITLTFNLKVQAVNRLLARLGSSTMLPDEADGKAIRLQIPDGIATEGTLTGKPVRLLQFGKPELTADGEIPVDAVRDAVLELPVLPESLRTKLAAIGDWQNTLPIPVPADETSNFQLAGHDAMMTEDGATRYLLWLDGNRVNLLSGRTSDFPSASVFQQAAEELAKK